MFFKKVVPGRLIIFAALAGLFAVFAFPSLAQNGLPTAPLSTIITRVINWLLTVSAGLAILFIIAGGAQYIIAAGDQDQLDRGKRMMTYALLGLFFIGISYAIVKTVATIIG